jgi:hypothetical protein
VSSEAINGQVAAVSFSVASYDHIVVKTAVPVTLGFTLSALLGTITLSFPTALFAASTPAIMAGSSSVAGLNAHYLDL